MLDAEAASPVLLATKLEQPLGTIAYHVRVLYDLGLLDLVGTRQRRGATEHYYRTKDHPRFTDHAWDQLDVVAKQRVLTAVLNEAHEYATRSAAAGGFDAPDAHFTRTPFKLDDEGWTELAKASKRWLEEAADIEHAAAGRLEADPHSAVDVGLVILLFEALAFSAGDPAKSERAERRPDGRQKHRRDTKALAAE
ncbi:MAG: hypothetical protein ACREP1_03225, partial [Rhodanobacteraceae bacterium]